MNMNCPFCYDGRNPAAFASESGFSALYNLSPILTGHSLVFPERHVRSLFELDEDDLAHFFSFARKVTGFLCGVYKCGAFDWSLQEGTEAGQSVQHLHLHIIPRKPGDLNEGEEWYGLLQHSLDPENKERYTLSDTEYHQITSWLKKTWENNGTG